MPTTKIAASVGGIAATAAIVFIVVFVLIGSRQSPTAALHTDRSIELAFNWVKCGQFSSISSDGGIWMAFSGTIEDLSAVQNVDRPLTELAEMSAGSVAAYCDGPFVQRTNEDSSLFYLLSFLLRLWPGASLVQLHVLATGFIALGISLMGYATLIWTRRVVLSAGIVLAGTLWYSQMTLHQFMGNPMFAWIFLMFAVFLMAWGVSQVVAGRLLRAGAVVFAAGIVAAFAANMRSTVTPEIPFLVIAMGIGVMATTRSESTSWWRARKVRHAGALVAVFAVAWVAYQTVAIGPIESIEGGGLTGHPIAHVLVIGLAVPGSDLSRDEGIKFSDAVGFEIGERYRPGSTDTFASYEDAMFDYYFDLWRDRPVDMVRTYIGKANVTGTSLYPQLRNIGVGWISPLNLVPNGILLGVILVTLTLWSFVKRVGPPVQAFLWRSLLITLLGGYVVSMAIFPLPSLYVPELPFAFIVLTVVFWWAVGHFALMAMTRQEIIQNGQFGRITRFAHRWW